MEKIISIIMLQEHGKIIRLLEDFENQLDNLKIAKKKFDIFKWNLEKHFFVEEKVIFSIYNTGKEDNDILNLLKEHKDILWMIAKMENSLKNNLKPETSKIKKSFEAHTELEDRIFYPKLDESLDEKQKNLIIERTKEIINE